MNWLSFLTKIYMHKSWGIKFKDQEREQKLFKAKG